MAKRIQIRRDISSIWTLTNPTLGQAEFGFEIDTKKIKIGDGTTPWNNLGYFGAGSTAWVSTLTYIEDAIVGLGGKIYISLQDNNLGNDPATEPTWWEEFSGGAGGLDKTFQTLVYAAQIITDGSISVNSVVTLTDTTAELQIPTNPVLGELFTWDVIQDAVGGRLLTYAAGFQFSGGIVPILSATPNAKDSLTFICKAANIFEFKYATFDTKQP